MDFIIDLEHKMLSNPLGAVVFVVVAFLVFGVGLYFVFIIGGTFLRNLSNQDWEEVLSHITNPKFGGSEADVLERDLLETNALDARVREYMKKVNDLVECISKYNKIKVKPAGKFFQISANNAGTDGWKPVTKLGKTAKKVWPSWSAPMNDDPGNREPTPYRLFGLVIFPLCAIILFLNFLDYLAASPFAETVTPFFEKYLPIILKEWDSSGNGILAWIINIAIFIFLYFTVFFDFNSTKLRIYTEATASFLFLVISLFCLDCTDGMKISAFKEARLSFFILAAYIGHIILCISSARASRPSICNLVEMITNLRSFREKNNMYLNGNDKIAIDILLSYYARLPHKTAAEWDEYVDGVRKNRSTEKNKEETERKIQKHQQEIESYKFRERNGMEPNPPVASEYDLDTDGGYKLDLLPDNIRDSGGTLWTALYRESNHVEYSALSEDKRYLTISFVDSSKSFPDAGVFYTDQGKFYSASARG